MFLAASQDRHEEVPPPGTGETERERERENERDTAAATRQEGLQSGFRKSSQRVSFGPAEGQASGIQPGTDERFLLAAPIEVREDSPESR